MTTETDFRGQSVFWEGTTPVPNATDDVCAEQTGITFQIIWILIISVIVLCNLFLLIAMAKSWRVLRQNIVHRYLISCLLSVVAFCLLSAYEIFHTIDHLDETFLGETVLQKFNASNPLHHSVMQRYSYRKCLLPIFAIVMQFNILVLIYAVSDNTFFVGRNTITDLYDKTHSTKKGTKLHIIATFFKKHKHVFVCLLAWFCPLVLSIPVAFGWSCVQHCVCLPAYRWGSTCVPGGNINECSRTWLPMSRSFVIVTTFCYFAAMAMNFGLLYSTVNKFHKAHVPHPSERPSTDLSYAAIGKEGISSTQTVFANAALVLEDDSKGSCNMHENFSKGTLRDAALPSCDVSPTSVRRDDTNPQCQNVETRRKQRENTASYDRGRRRPLDRTIILLIVVTCAMFLSVTPMICIWFLDVVIVSDVSSGYGFSIALSLSYAYCAVLPFILVKCMSGLRRACVSFFVTCPCLHTTTVVKKPPTSSPELASTK